MNLHPYVQKLTDDDCKKAAVMFEEGKLVKEVAGAFKVSARGLVKAMQARGLPASRFEVNRRKLK